MEDLIWLAKELTITPRLPEDKPPIYPYIHYTPSRIFVVTREQIKKIRQPRLPLCPEMSVPQTFTVKGHRRHKKNIQFEAEIVNAMRMSGKAWFQCYLTFTTASGRQTIHLVRVVSVRLDMRRPCNPQYIKLKIMDNIEEDEC